LEQSSRSMASGVRAAGKFFLFFIKCPSGIMDHGHPVPEDLQLARKFLAVMYGTSV
jgi:hypothetical protein